MIQRLLLWPASLALVVSAACGREAGVPGGGPEAQSQAPLPVEDPDAAVAAWREKHEADYRYEFASINGLHALEPGAQTVGSDPGADIVIAHLPPAIGRVVVEGQTVTFVPETGIAVVRKGARARPQPGQPPDEVLTGPIVLHGPSADPGPEIAVGSVRLVVHTGGGRLALRVRDPQGEQARRFLGFSWFPVDAAYRVTGRFIRDDEPRRLQVQNTHGDIDTYTTEGVVEFELGGTVMRLRPFTTRPKRFYFVFRDGSSGEETYETARFLYSDLAEDGTTVLDFNAAYNPPCAFNPYTTCPIPLRENRLPLKILAGEKAYPTDTKLVAPPQAAGPGR